MDEFTMTCEHCGRTWDGNAQCPCPESMGIPIEYKKDDNTVYYQKLYEDLNTLVELDPQIDTEMVDKLLRYIDTKLVSEN